MVRVGIAPKNLLIENSARLDCLQPAWPSTAYFRALLRGDLLKTHWTGRELRELRLICGLTQQHFARMLDVPQTTLSRWERKDYSLMPDSGPLEKLNNLYGTRNEVHNFYMSGLDLYPESHDSISFSYLFQSYVDWCRHYNLLSLSRRKFLRQFRELASHAQIRMTRVLGQMRVFGVVPRPWPATSEDVPRFYKERIETRGGSGVTATTLYEHYCSWCEENTKEPLPLSDFGRAFGALGVQKVKTGGRVWYIGIKLKSDDRSPRDIQAPPEPKPASGPDYAPKNGKLASVAHVPSESEVEDQAKLHHRLRKKAETLKAALRNVGNQYPELVRVADEYLSLLAPETAEIDVAGLWSVGGALSALLGAYKEQQAHQTLSAPLEPEATAALTSLVRDHGAFVLGFEEGRKLVERADEFALEPQLIRETEKSGRALMVELSTNEQLIDELTRRLHASINDAVQKAGWTAGRHTYAAYATIRNFVRAVIKYSIGKEANIGAIMGILAGGSALAGDPNCEIIRAALPFLKQYSAQLLAFFNHSPEYRAYVAWAIGLLEEHARSLEERDTQHE